MKKSELTAPLILLLLVAIAIGFTLYGIQRIAEHKAENSQPEQIDSAQARVLYEDIWDKALPFREEDL